MRLQLRGASVRHPAARPGSVPALRGIDLVIEPGERVAVIGPSGAGKTTLLQVLGCALPLARGQLQVAGLDPWALPRAALQRLRGRLYLAPQAPPLPPRQRVVTSVLAARLPALGIWGSLVSLVYPRDIPAAYEALERFDLGNKLFERVDRLSGGERQRVGLARVLLAPATLWLVDEPLSALDPTRAGQALAALRDEAVARSATLVTSLHQVDMALAHFPRIVGLRDGQLAFDLPAAQVSPEHLARLYAQHEDEWRPTPAGQGDSAPPGPTPVVMHCR